MRSIDADIEDKYSAATLADVLVDVPATLAFPDIISYVLNQLQLLKDDMFCSKGTYRIKSQYFYSASASRNRFCAIFIQLFLYYKTNLLQFHIADMSRQ